MPLFAPFGTEALFHQFDLLILHAYVNTIPKLAVNEKKLAAVRKQQFNQLQKNSNFKSYEQKDLPKNLDEIFELYMAQPITEEDKTKYLSTYRVPLYKTGQTINELDKINPGAMAETLNLLMISKKLQYVLQSLRSICINIRFKIICENDEFKKDRAAAIEKYSKILEEVETDIAVSWAAAIEIEDRFKAHPNILKLNSLGYRNLSLKNLNKYRNLLKGGKRRTVKKNLRSKK